MKFSYTFIAVLALAIGSVAANAMPEDSDEPYPEHIRVVPDFFKRAPQGS
ncbi:hypothetical protein F5Y10DRAFT_265732 [Nemania abortiva]|nr:hypothetical protein F5Y10DRAFT_265732 [Nemania abortiva]